MSVDNRRVGHGEGQGEEGRARACPHAMATVTRGSAQLHGLVEVIGTLWC